MVTVLSSMEEARRVFAENIVFPGEVEQEEVRNCLSRCKAFALANAAICIVRHCTQQNAIHVVTDGLPSENLIAGQPR